ncbi:hypothetical protein OAA37_00780 [bacterium]|jgi:hypothetical protein|nr:hypothetical protein [bacterium]MDB4347989.1 hypothetical protein [bacterium]
MTIYKLKTEFDLWNLRDLVKREESLIEYYKSTRISQENHYRINTTFPMGENHRAKNKDAQNCYNGFNGNEEITSDFIASSRKTNENHHHMIIMDEKFKRDVDDEIKNLIERIAEEENILTYSKVNMALIYKSPKLSIVPHIDQQKPQASRGVRYHCVLKSNNRNMINDMVVTEGEIWAIDTNYMHSAANDHDTLPSLHFVIDYME